MCRVQCAVCRVECGVYTQSCHKPSLTSLLISVMSTCRNGSAGFMHFDRRHSWNSQTNTVLLPQARGTGDINRNHHLSQARGTGDINRSHHSSPFWNCKCSKLLVLATEFVKYPHAQSIARITFIAASWYYSSQNKCFVVTPASGSRCRNTGNQQANISVVLNWDPCRKLFNNVATCT